MPSLMGRSEEVLMSFAKRDCYYDRFGRQRCSNWSTGARVGAGIAIAVAIIIFIVILGGLGRRRRAARMSSTQPIYSAGGAPAAYFSGQGAAPVGQEQGSYYQNQQEPYQYQNQTGGYYPQTGQAGANYAYPPQTDGSAYAPPPGPPPSGDGQYAMPAAPPPAYVDGSSGKKA